MTEEQRRFWGATATIAGTIFGVGVFALPHTIARSGPAAGLFWFVILGSAILFLHILYGSIQINGNSHRRLIGLVENNLGEKFKFIPFISTIIGTSGALLVYLIVGGKFTSLFLEGIIDISPEKAAIIIWAILSTMVLLGIRSVASFEILASIAMFLGLGVLVAALLDKGALAHIPQGSPENSFLPYGVILFSLYGANAIPKAAEILTSKKNKLRQAILLGSTLPLISYILFTFAVLSLSGENTSTEAITGLILLLNPWVIKLALAIGFLAIATSFVSIGLYLADTLNYDLKFQKISAGFTAVFIPLLLFLIGIRSFNTVIGFVGSLLGGVDGILIAAIFLKLSKRSEFESLIRVNKLAPLILITIFLFGIAGEAIVFLTH